MRSRDTGVNNLEEILVSAKQALLHGELDQLQALTEQTEIALSVLAATDSDALQHISQLANENATLLTAAARGVAAAQRVLNGEEPSNQIYSANGQVADLPKEGATWLHRF